MNDYERWAKFVSSKLTNEELEEFVTMLDGDAYHQFTSYMARIDAERNPHLYADTETEVVKES